MLMSLVVFGGQAYGVQRKVTLAATTVANIFAQANNNNASTITAAELNQILAYPSLVLYPYSSANVAVEVSQLLVTVNQNGTATGTVTGSWANANGTARPINQQLSVDPSIASAFSGTGNNLCRAWRGAVSFSADRALLLRRPDHAARFDHHDPAGREPDHRAVTQRCKSFSARRGSPGLRARRLPGSRHSTSGRRWE